MAFNSDYNRMKDLLETEELTHIEFSEHWGSENSEYNIAKKSQHGGFESDDINYLFTTDEKKHRGHKQRGGNEPPIDYLFDYDDKNDKQTGGYESDEADIDYLFTPVHKSQHGGSTNEIEHDFLSIFNTAKEYSKRIENIANKGNSKVDVVLSESATNQTGGYDSDFMNEYDETANYSQFGG